MATTEDDTPIGLSDQDIAQMEREAREEIGDVIRKHTCRLPLRSRLRKPLIEMSFIDHAIRVAAYETREQAEIAAQGGMTGQGVS